MHMMQVQYCYRRRKLICHFMSPLRLGFDRLIAIFLSGVVVRGPRAQLNNKDRIAVLLSAVDTGRKQNNSSLHHEVRRLCLPPRQRRGLCPGRPTEQGHHDVFECL
jgi:hypothetical protein